MKKKHVRSMTSQANLLALKRLTVYMSAMTRSPLAHIVRAAGAPRTTLPMSPEELLDAAVLVYLRGLGLPAA